MIDPCFLVAEDVVCRIVDIESQSINYISAVRATSFAVTPLVIDASEKTNSASAKRRILLLHTPYYGVLYDQIEYSTIHILYSTTNSAILLLPTIRQYRILYNTYYYHDYTLLLLLEYSDCTRRQMTNIWRVEGREIDHSVLARKGDEIICQASIA